MLEKYLIAYELSDSQRSFLVAYTKDQVEASKPTEDVRAKRLTFKYASNCAMFAFALHLTGCEKTARVFLNRANLKFRVVGLIAEKSRNWLSYSLPVHPTRFLEDVVYVLAILPGEELTGRPLSKCTRVILVGSTLGRTIKRHESYSELYRGCYTKNAFELHPIIDLPLAATEQFRVDIEKVTR